MEHFHSTVPVLEHKYHFVAEICQLMCVHVRVFREGRAGHVTVTHLSGPGIII